MRHTLTVRASAKINLHLGVGAPREDGFHPLDTVYQAVSLHDDLTVCAAPATRLGMRMAEYVDRDGVPTGEDNIILAALSLLERHHGRALPTDLLLDKAIPVAGGMAGGSADAAAALVAIDRWHDLQTSDDDLLALAAELGSDVPFALVGGTAHGTGRGEVVEPVPDPGAWTWVVVPSAEGLSTPAVYRHFDALAPDAPETPDLTAPASARPVLEALATGDPHALADVLHNDLQAAAVDLRPDLAVLIALGESLGALRGIVSGSGPTCVFLCEDLGDATRVAAGLREEHPVALVAHGPAAGAHVVESLR